MRLIPCFMANFPVPTPAALCGDPVCVCICLCVCTQLKRQTEPVSPALRVHGESSSPPRKGRPRGGIPLCALFMAEDIFWHSTVANPLDHGGMVPGIRVNFTAWHHLSQGEEGGVVGHKTGREQERRIFAVEVGQCLLQFYVELARSRNIPSSPSSSTMLFHSLHDSPTHPWVSTHA